MMPACLLTLFPSSPPSYKVVHHFRMRKLRVPPRSRIPHQFYILRRRPATEFINQLFLDRVNSRIAV